MAVPSFEHFFLPTLKVLSLEMEIHVSEVRDYVAIELGLTEEDLAELTKGGGKTKSNDRTDWALTHLYQAGLVGRPRRAFYSLTGEGAAVLDMKPRHIDQNFLKQYASYRDFLARTREPKKTPEEPSKPPHLFDEATPEIRMEDAYAEWRTAIESEILELVHGGPPQFLERVIVQLLVKMGYGGGDPARASVTGRPGDRGIDGVIGQDALGLDKVYIQAKRYGAESKVRSGEIQQFVGVLAAEGMNKGVFVTTSDFTDNARKEATRGAYNIVLINGEMLANLMVSHDIGVREGTVYPLKRIDADFFDHDAPPPPVEGTTSVRPSRGFRHRLL